MKKGYKTVLISLLVVFMIALSAAVYLYIDMMRALRSRPLHEEYECKSNLHSIAVAIHRYGVDHNNLYPEDLSFLRTEEYSTPMPRNPFDPENRREMRNVDFFGEHTEGDFSFIPFIMNEQVTGFYVIGYGSQKEFERERREFESLGPARFRGNRQDVDSDGVLDNVIYIYMSDNDLPPLAEYLKQIK